MISEARNWDATETAELIAKKEVSAAEVIESAIARATESQPRIHAIAAECYETAKSKASGPSPGVFSGVPTFIKDLENLKGVPTGMGSRAVRGRIPEESDGSVRQFLSTGCIPLGKSTAAEFGLTATTEPVNGEPTRNPTNLEHSSGGSSGGAAALVADRVVPIAHASDGGGSIRIPASFCGLVGLKPTRGRLVDLASAKIMLVKITTYGVLTRTVRDTANFYAEVRDVPGSNLPPIGRVEGPGNRKFRIGFFTQGPFGFPTDPETEGAISALAKRLEGMGHNLFEIPSPFSTKLADDFLLHWGLMASSVEAAVLIGRLGDVNDLEPWSRGLARELRRKFWRLPGAIWRLRQFEHTYAKAFWNCDILLCPTTATPAPPLGYLSPSLSYKEKLERLSLIHI